MCRQWVYLVPTKLVEMIRRWDFVEMMSTSPYATGTKGAPLAVTRQEDRYSEGARVCDRENWPCSSSSSHREDISEGGCSM